MDTKLTLLGHSLVNAVNERSKQREKILGEIRSLIKLVESIGLPKEQSDVLALYAKNFLPLFFRIYADIQKKSEDTSIVSDKIVKLSAYETIRLYSPFISKELVSSHVNLALKKMQDSSISDDRKVRHIFHTIELREPS